MTSFAYGDVQLALAVGVMGVQGMRSTGVIDDDDVSSVYTREFCTCVLMVP